MRNRIKLAIALIQETSKAVRAMPLIVFFPVFKYIALFALSAWTIYIWAMLATSGSKVTSKVTALAAEKEVNFEPNRVFQLLTIYVALGYFWTLNWFIAIAQTTTAGAIAKWYWTRDKLAIPVFPVWGSFYRTVRYHLGSLAFGSLVIAIIQTIQMILTYIQYQLSKHKKNRIISCILACMQCCLGCFERFMKFLNKNAYIEIAIYGYSFVVASKMAFQLLTRNAVRLMVVDRVSIFLFFLGKLAISMATVFIGSIMLQPADESERSRFWSVPLIIIGVISYIIASCFMTVFDMAVDTLFLCFCEDSERNDGKTKPYYMTESLQKFISDANREAQKQAGMNA
jgi:hypothetical protein